MNSFGQSSQYMSIKFPLLKQSENTWTCNFPRLPTACDFMVFTKYFSSSTLWTINDVMVKIPFGKISKFYLASEMSKIATKSFLCDIIDGPYFTSLFLCFNRLFHSCNKNSFCLERPCSKDLVQIGYIRMKTNLCWNLFVHSKIFFFLFVQENKAILNHMFEIF